MTQTTGSQFTYTRGIATTTTGAKVMGNSRADHHHNQKSGDNNRDQTRTATATINHNNENHQGKYQGWKWSNNNEDEKDATKIGRTARAATIQLQSIPKKTTTLTTIDQQINRKKLPQYFLIKQWKGRERGRESETDINDDEIEVTKWGRQGQQFSKNKSQKEDDNKNNNWTTDTDRKKFPAIRTWYNKEMDDSARQTKTMM